jgi:hypothetical protein
MLEVSQFSVLSVNDGRPLVVVAEKVGDDDEALLSPDNSLAKARSQL